MRWHAALSACLRDLGRPARLLELGPGRVLTALAERDHPGHPCRAVNTGADVAALLRV